MPQSAAASPHARILRADSAYDEITLPRERILYHFLDAELHQQSSLRVRIIPSGGGEPPVYHVTGQHGFYFANIGSPEDPLLLELRFVPIPTQVRQISPAWLGELKDPEVRIALLMTNERYPRDLQAIASAVADCVVKASSRVDAVLAPESLGAKLGIEVARELARRSGRDIFATSFQKGKPREDRDGRPSVGPPKPWVVEEAGIAVSSGTSAQDVRQMLFLDQDIAAEMSRRKMRILLVDDALLTQGTLDSAIRLAHLLDLDVTQVVTVLNEGPPIREIHGIPYRYLTKLPLFARVPGGVQPIPGTCDGLPSFFVLPGRATSSSGAREG